MKTPEPKSEIQNLKSETNSKSEIQTLSNNALLRYSNFEFSSSFEFLVSGFVACLIVALIAIVPQCCEAAATFFTEDFAHGSTLNAAPVNPTATSTSYEMISSKSWTPAPSLTSGDLKFGIASTTSGSIEVQALFTNSPVALVVEGDYLEMKITFTNTGGLLTAAGALGF